MDVVTMDEETESTCAQGFIPKSSEDRIYVSVECKPDDPDETKYGPFKNVLELSEFIKSNFEILFGSDVNGDHEQRNDEDLRDRGQ